MKIRTNIKAGLGGNNHNEALVRAARKTRGIKVRTNVKAGGLNSNHNETMARY